MKRWLYTIGGNRMSKRRRIAKRKKALSGLLRAALLRPIFGCTKDE